MLRQISLRLATFCGAGLALLLSAANAQDTGPTHTERKPIQFDIGPGGKIETMAMDRQGNLVCGVSWGPLVPGAARPGMEGIPRPTRDGFPEEPGRSYAIKVVSPEGNILSTWPLEGVWPKMIHGCEDGTIFVGGGEQLILLDAQGKTLHRVEIAQILDGAYRGAHVSGVTACDKYIFVAFGHGFSVRATEDVVRFDRRLGSPQVVVKQMFGCCSHIDLDVRDDVLLVAENSRHRVNRYSLDGQALGTWGQRDRTNIEGFAACCNPVNFDFGPQGVLYTAESGIGRVKKYTPEGKYLGLVGYVDTTKFDNGSAMAAASCYIPVEVSADGRRVYVMDVRAHVIRVLVQNSGTGE